MTRIEPALTLGRGGIRHPDVVEALTVLPDGTVVAADRSGEICAWGTPDGADRGVLRHFGEPIRTATASPDRTRLACALGDSTIRVLNLPGGQETAALGPMEDTTECLCFTPDGRGLLSVNVIGKQRVLRLWDLYSGSSRVYLKQKTSIEHLSMTPDGTQVVAALGGGRLRWLDARTGDLLFKFRIPGGRETGAQTCSPDGRFLAVGCADGSLRLYDTRSHEQARHVRTSKDKWDEVQALAFSPDGLHLAVGRAGGGISILDVAGEEIRRLDRRHSSYVTALDYSPDGRLLASGGTDAAIHIWDAAAGRALLAEDRHAGAIGGLAFSPDGGMLATGSADTTIRLWDLDSGGTLATFAGRRHEPHPLAFSPDGRVLAGCGDQGAPVRLWDVAGRRELAAVPDGARPKHLAFSPDGRFLAFDDEDAHILRLLDMQTGQLDRRFLLPGRPLFLAWLGNDRRLGVVEEDARSASVFRVLDLESGSETTRFPLGRWFGGGAMGRPGRHLYAAVQASDEERSSLRAWSIADGREMYRLPDHPGDGRGHQFCLDCSEDERLLVSAIRFSREVVLWDLESRKPALSLPMPGRVESLRLGPGAGRLSVGLANSAGLVYDLAAVLLGLVGRPGPVPKRTPCVFLDGPKRPVPAPAEAKAAPEAAERPAELRPFTLVKFHLANVSVMHSRVLGLASGQRQTGGQVDAWLLPEEWLVVSFGEDCILWPWNGWPTVHFKSDGTCLHLAPEAEGPWTLLAVGVRTDSGRRVLRGVKPPATVYGISVSGEIGGFLGDRIEKLGIRSVTLSDFRQTAICRLTDFGKIEALTVYPNQPPLDLAPLRDLEHFRALDACGTDVLESFDEAAGLGHLEHLALSSSVRIADCSVLASLGGLRHLDLTCNDVLADLGFLSGLGRLRGLNLHGCPEIADHAPLAGLESLVHLDLHGHKRLENLDWASSLRELAWLNLSWCSSLENLRGLAGLANLLYLNLSSCERIVNADAILKLPRLVRLEGNRALACALERRSSAAVPVGKPETASGQIGNSAEKSAAAEAFLVALAGLGWFEPLTAALREDLEHRVREWDGAPDSLHDSLACAWVDTECVYDRGEYEVLLLELADASHGAFRPENISERWNLKKEEIGLSFRHGGKVFRRKLKYHGDWLDPAVFEVVNEALGASGTELRFMPLPGGGGDIHVTLTTPELFRRAEAGGLLPGRL